MFWLYVIVIGITVAGVAISSDQAAKAAKASSKKLSLKDVEVPTADDGRTIPVIFGTVDLKGPQICWNGKIGFEAIKSEGGKK